MSAVKKKEEYYVSRVDREGFRLISLSTEDELFCRNRNYKEMAHKRAKEIVVGDIVNVDISTNTPFVSNIKKRKTELFRRDGQKTARLRLIAANLSHVAIVVSVYPMVGPAWIDRLLAVAISGGIKPIIVVNKQDLDPDLEVFKDLEDAYSACDFKLFSVSANTGAGLDEFKEFLHENKTLLIGQSGVGKSSILKKIMPEQEIMVAEINRKTGKGKHTTTYSQSYKIGNGIVFDTPGVKEFGICNLKSQNLVLYYPEIQNASYECKFRNCSHLNENHCAVAEAVENGIINYERYHSFIKLRAELEEKEKSW